MIHQYRNNGYNIVMDVYSGSVHVVDDVCYDVIAKLNGSETEPTAGSLKETGVKIDTKNTKVNIDSEVGWQGCIPHMTVLCLSAELLLKSVHILSMLQY